MHINDATDYIILKVDESGEQLNHLKLQKLLYYSKAWYLAYTKKELFPENFQAWIHGPVCREVYNRFATSKSLYGDVTRSDMMETFNPDSLNSEEKEYIDAVLEAYAKFSGTQLESLTHVEEPWINARHGYTPTQRCEVFIKNEDMIKCYKERIKTS